MKDIGVENKILDKDLLTYKNINHELNTKVMGKNIIHFDTIDSTNEYAKQIANSEIEGTVIISENQTKGRGRWGRKWHSKLDEGVYMSIILKPDILLEKTPFLTLIAGASIVNALNNLGVEALIKWPNDIILNYKKISGILTELSADIEKIDYVIVGIGINVKNMNFSDEISDIATSLYKEGYNISKVDIVKNILFEFEKLYFEYINNNYKKNILDICRKYSAVIGKDIYILKQKEMKLVNCIGINEDGHLVVDTGDKNIEEIRSGEVSIRGVEGYV